MAIKPRKSDTKEKLLFYIETLNERLEKEKKTRYSSNTKLNKQTERVNELEYLVEELHKDNDALHNQLEELERTKDNEIQKLINELNDLKKNNVAKKNERNAGRKSVISEDVTNKVITMSSNGYAQKLIAEHVGVSVGTVNKILKSQKSVEE